MKLVISLYLSHIRIFKERSDKSQKSTFTLECSFLSSDQVQHFTTAESGGAKRDRTADLLRARQA
ncbi:hypothetical protein MXM82_26960, partial [Pseudomonas asiatica]|nr:hypothetical protein [Pseudomonas asiatica]